MMKLYRYGLPLLVVCVSWFASLVLGQVDSVTQLGPLRSLAVRAGIEFGTAVSASHLDEDSVYRTLLSREFSSITPENEMKWESLEPEPGRYVWENADRIVAFARAHQQRIRGHTLVWHNQMPVWLKCCPKFGPPQER
ncbi:endo-1,4-beta-xylanase, partial [Thermus brockianus]